MTSYLLGLDLGSSFVKANLIEAETGKTVASATVPGTEMEITSHQPGWAEQDPGAWWQNVKAATHQVLRDSSVAPFAIKAIGISYQMHGLVIVDKNLQVLRPSIIWCDSRAVRIGEKANTELGSYCLRNLLNSPGNFTASKLKWVKENEPTLYEKVHKAMLPGDYIAMKMTGEVTTTASGLSEGILWDFREEKPATKLLENFGIGSDLLAEVVPAFGIQGKLSGDAATELGLAKGTPLCYRAGDQPNNAFSLKALQPGEVAATAGTSGVIYAVTDKQVADEQSRVNTFLHVNHKKESPRLGVLLCVNGSGIMYRWLRNQFKNELTYNSLNELASLAPIGSGGLTYLPFGNGAERILGSKELGASFHSTSLARPQRHEMSRAVQEGIAFALAYGFEIFRELGIKPNVIRAGQGNLFQSEIFCETFANVTAAELQLFNTDGAQGAARAAGVGAGLYPDTTEAFKNFKCLRSFEPQLALGAEYVEAYTRWKETLQRKLQQS